MAFEKDGAFVDPTPIGGGFDHGKFSADAIGGGGEGELIFDAVDDVEIRESGFDHDDVRAFGNIERDFAQSFGGVARVHLVGAAIAELRSGFGGFAEGAVESGGELRGVGHDRRVQKFCGVERLANRADAAIHHVAGSDEVGAGFGMADGGAREKFEGGVVQDFGVRAVAFDDAAMTVAHVFAEANVGNDEEFRQRFFQRANCLLNDAVAGVSAGGLFVFGFRNAEKNYGAHAGFEGGFGFAEDFIDGKLENAGHGADGFANIFSGAREQRQNEAGVAEGSFGDEIAQRGSRAEATQTLDRKSAGKFLHGQDFKEARRNVERKGIGWRGENRGANQGLPLSISYKHVQCLGQ
jgi:hypothetical protein